VGSPSWDPCGTETGRCLWTKPSSARRTAARPWWMASVAQYGFFLGICWDMNGILTVYYWNIHWIWMGYEYIPSGNDCPTMIWLLQRVSTIWIATTRHDISNADGYWWMGFINQHHIPSGNDCPIAIENKYHLEWSKNKIFSAIRSGHLAQCNLLNWFLSTLW